MAKKILIIVGGPVKKIEDFKLAADELKSDVTLASFSDIEYFGKDSDIEFRVGENSLTDFNLIYIRMVGKRFEDATLLINFAKEKGIKIVDSLYESNLFIPTSISKANEMKVLLQNGIPMPRTYYADINTLLIKSPQKIGYPFLIKSTTGKKGRDIWTILSNEDISNIRDLLISKQKEGTRFFSQELIETKERVRVFVVGEKILGGFTRPTKWEKALARSEGRDPLTGNEFLDVPEDYSKLALSASNALKLDIAGVDILKSKDGKLYVIEANAAPSWNIIKRKLGIKVEEEILRFLISSETSSAYF